MSGSLLLTDQEDLLSVTTSESKTLLADCERLGVAGPDIIPLPLKHRRKIIAIPVSSGCREGGGSGSPQAYRELSPPVQPPPAQTQTQTQAQSKLSPPTPFADITPVSCCFTPGQSRPEGREIISTLQAFNLGRDMRLS